MLERKRQLAFRLDKIYFLKKHSNDVFKQLLDSGIDALRMVAEVDQRGTTGDIGPTKE